MDRAGPGVEGSPAVSARQLTKDYGQGSNTVHALRGIDVNFDQGRFTAIMGPSGSGKSTLMHVLAGLDTVTSGHVYMAAHLLHSKSGDRHHPPIDQAGRVDLTRLDDRQLTLIRRRHLGFIFQSFNLLPMFTAKQNILMPLVLDDVRPDTSWMEQLVETLGLSERLDHRPSELSGGQQQRVAIARALITKPSIVFADEPTGNLDTASSTEVLSFLRDSVRELGQTVIMVTHDAYAASYADRALVFADGRIVADRQNPTVKAMNDLLAEQVSAGTADDSQVQD
ncbi:peptide ABC transporter ATP-binding protein [Bifidobacterium asteroides DSM 20089]|uniref:Peptide ABC transporter ATP-binding protein n=1 Tax=Bifidobacterium asteroides DSM 20089 TaxID=1437594 RepID=A0AAD0ACB0_9BIFI|nr:peptide ABC transporter ATP-binding protein [Bifidobacterium asteroides DSM 20089]